MGRQFLPGLLLLLCLPVFAAGYAPVLQINCFLRDISNLHGAPGWTLILRDVDSGEVRPYFLDISKKNSFWVKFAPGHNYRVTASQLAFGGQKMIGNFCELEDGVLGGVSMMITLSGRLTPDRATSRCRVFKFAGPGVQQ